MKYIKDYKDGDRIFDIYYCKYKSSAVTKNGKSYDNVIIQDKTGTLVWQTWLIIIGSSSLVLWIGELIRLVKRLTQK